MAEAGQDKTLRDVAIGETATVRRLVGEGALKRHIMDMASPKASRFSSARWRRSAILSRSPFAAMSFRCARAKPKACSFFSSSRAFGGLFLCLAVSAI